MSDVTEELTRKVAHLSRLELSDSEVKQFTQQLGDILKYVDQLSEVDVQGVEPLSNPLEMQLSLREDELRENTQECLDEEGKPKILKSAPDALYDGFRVPPIL